MKAVSQIASWLLSEGKLNKEQIDTLIDQEILSKDEAKSWGHEYQKKEDYGSKTWMELIEMLSESPGGGDYYEMLNAAAQKVEEGCEHHKLRSLILHVKGQIEAIRKEYGISKTGYYQGDPEIYEEFSNKIRAKQPLEHVFLNVAKQVFAECPCRKEVRDYCEKCWYGMNLDEPKPIVTKEYKEYQTDEDIPF